MEQRYNILLVEDNHDDVDILRYHLKRVGFDFELTVVETEEVYVHQIASGRHNIIISDYQLPQFSGRRALQVLKESGFDIPFLLVSGAVGDEIAVDMLKNGCVDYILKDKLTRLPSAVERAVHEANVMRERMAAVEAMRESEKRFRYLADNSPMLIWMSDVTGKTSYVNDTWCRFTGRTFDSTKDNNWIDVIHPDDWQRSEDEYYGAFHRREKVVSEYRLLRHDGVYRWIIDTGVPNYLPGGEFVGYLGSLVDITERKEMEEQLRESERKFRSLFDNHVAVKLLIDPETSSIIDANAAAVQYYGWSHDELTQMKVFDINIESVEFTQKNIAQAAERGRNFFTVRHRLHSGAIRDVEVLSSVIEIAGKKVLYSIIHDVTDKVRSELAQQKSEAKLSMLFHSHPVKIVTDPQSGDIVDVNRAAEEFYGWSMEQLLSKRVQDIVHGPSIAFHDRIREVLTGRTQMFQLKHRLKDGTVRDVEVYPTLIEVDGRMLLHEIILDITAKVRAEQQAKLNDTALNSAQNAIMITDRSGTVIWANPAYARLSGYELNEMIGTRAGALVHSGVHPPEFFTLLWNTIIAGKAWKGSMVNRKKDGTLFNVEQTITPILDEGGNVTHFVSVNEDITERKRMELTLRSTTEMLDKFFHQSLDACYFMQLRRPVEWTAGNQREELLKEIFETAAVAKLNSSLLRQYHLNDVSAFLLDVHMLFDDEFPKVKGILTHLFDHGTTYYSTTLKRADDKSEIVVEGNAVCIFDDDHRITGFFGIQRDVTQSVREREQLQQNQDRYKRFFEEDMTGDFIVRADGIVVTCNKAFAHMFGYSSVADVVGISATMLYVDLKEREELYRILKREGKVENHLLHGRRRNGEEFIALMTAIGHLREDGSIDEIVGYLLDDSRRQEMEQQMIQAQKMESIGQLASGVAHDFNNILNNIYGFSQQLVKYHREPARILKYSDTIAKSAQRGTEVASKLLSFARMKKAESSVLDITPVVNEVAQMCRDTFLHSVDVTVQQDADLWRIQGERSGLYQMMLNICTNAKDAMSEVPTPGYHGLLSIEVHNRTEPKPDLHWFRNSPPTHYVEVIIRDTGPGIPSATIERIFDPFFSTKKSNTQKGTGLGLTVVYNLVKSHQGAIQVKSDVGHGTAFHIYLPAVKHSKEEAGVQETGPFLARNNELVLLVDDEEGMRELGRELLEESGYRVLVCSGGLEGVSVFREHKDEIALVILDLVMPDLDGGQAYLQMKKLRADIKAFFCSGYITETVLTPLLAEENLAALQKPFRPDQFVKFVHTTLYS